MENQKVFGKCALLKGIFLIIAIIGVLFILISAGEPILSGIGIFLTSFSLIKVWILYSWKLRIKEDGIIINYGIIIKRAEEIKYKKINNIRTTSFLGIGGLQIITGNDMIMRFTFLENYDRVKEIISKNIE